MHTYYIGLSEIWCSFYTPGFGAPLRFDFWADYVYVINNHDITTTDMLLVLIQIPSYIQSGSLLSTKGSSYSNRL